MGRVKVQVNPTYKWPSGPCSENEGRGEAQELRQKFRPEKKFHEHTYLVNHKTVKQHHAFDKHGLKAYSGRSCGHRAV